MVLSASEKGHDFWLCERCGLAAWPSLPQEKLTQHGEKAVQGGLEPFSDGVIAILITIMVTNPESEALKVPHGAELQALLPL